MDLSQAFYDKFEIPLTIHETEQIFDMITPYNKYCDTNLIQCVYLPVHAEDGGSGRGFVYPYNKENYYNLIQRILKYKPIIITFPKGDPAVMEKYINMGVKRFMVSKWNDEYDNLKKKYPDLRIERSIVGNSNNEEIDCRFDGIVVPYKWLLNIEKIKEASKKVDLTVLPNHTCRVGCQYLDIHPIAHTDKYLNTTNTPFICPEGKSFFIPREILYNLLPYVKTIKLTDRQSTVSWYEAFINYYVYGEPFALDNVNLIQNGFVINNYAFSNMKSGMCEFKCDTCDKKCY